MIIHAHDIHVDGRVYLKYLVYKKNMSTRC